ncbi:hypothetical protein JCM19046_416 [Bacillus sp. JCM 19046]|nr:hypothetical protein JCM19046_416 [Bacillus sp. JCM 19046]
MNIYVILKRTFDTEEKITIPMEKFRKREQNLSLTLMMNTLLRKHLYCEMSMEEK